MASLFSNLVSWLKASPAVNQAKAAAIHDLTDAANQFVAVAAKAAPDLQQQIEQHVVNALTTAVTGLISKTK